MKLFRFFKRNSNLTIEKGANDINQENAQENKTLSNNGHIRKSENPRYTQELLSNGNTEQQCNDYNVKNGIYPVNTPVVYGMKLISSTVPPQDNYCYLNEEEKTFFHVFQQKLIEATYNPSLVQLTRLSDGTFNVDYIGLCYIGKICLYKAPTTYAVIKKAINVPLKSSLLLTRLEILLLPIVLLKSKKEHLSLILICNTP